MRNKVFSLPKPKPKPKPCYNNNKGDNTVRKILKPSAIGKNYYSKNVYQSEGYETFEEWMKAQGGEKNLYNHPSVVKPDERWVDTTLELLFHCFYNVDDSPIVLYSRLTKTWFFYREETGLWYNTDDHSKELKRLLEDIARNVITPNGEDHPQLCVNKITHTTSLLEKSLLGSTERDYVIDQLKPTTNIVVFSDGARKYDETTGSFIKCPLSPKNYAVRSLGYKNPEEDTVGYSILCKRFLDNFIDNITYALPERSFSKAKTKEIEDNPLELRELELELEDKEKDIRRQEASLLYVEKRLLDNKFEEPESPDEDPRKDCETEKGIVERTIIKLKEERKELLKTISELKLSLAEAKTKAEAENGMSHEEIRELGKDFLYTFLFGMFHNLYQKKGLFFNFYGQTQTGKSTFFTLLRLMMGEANTKKADDIKDLLSLNDKGLLSNYTLAFIDDYAKPIGNEASEFLSLTGNDLPCTLVIGSNARLSNKIGDEDAFDRRAIQINLAQSFGTDQLDTDVKNKIVPAYFRPLVYEILSLDYDEYCQKVENLLDHPIVRANKTLVMRTKKNNPRTDAINFLLTVLKPGEGKQLIGEPAKEQQLKISNATKVYGLTRYPVAWQVASTFSNVPLPFLLNTLTGSSFPLDRGQMLQKEILELFRSDAFAEIGFGKDNEAKNYEEYKASNGTKWFYDHEVRRREEFTNQIQYTFAKPCSMLYGVTYEKTHTLAQYGEAFTAKLDNKKKKA